jgi:hypothetical protein
MPYVSIWVLRNHPVKWGCRHHLDDLGFDFILGRLELRIRLLYFYVFTSRTSVPKRFLRFFHGVIDECHLDNKIKTKTKTKTKQSGFLGNMG